MRSVHRILIGCTLLGLVVPSYAAPADPKKENRVISDRWGVSAGGFLADLTTEAQVGFGRIVGSLLNLEDILDLDDNQSVLRMDGMFRFARKHAIEVGYLELDRTSIGTLFDEIQFRDLTFDGQFESKFDMQLFKTTYRYSFSNDGRLDAGFTMGLSTFKFNLGLEGDVQVSDPNGTVTLSRDGTEANLIAPVPVIGIFIDYAFTPRLVMRVKPEFFRLEVGDFDVRFVETRWTLDWYFSRHVGIGGGFNSTDLSYSDTGESPLDIEYRYSGALFYLSFVGGTIPGAGP